MEKDGLRTLIMFAAAKGDLELDEMGAIMEIMDHDAPLLRAVPQGEKKALGIKEMFSVLDIEGNPLVAGENYMFRGEKVKVLREQFGAGNALDTYYWVYYLNSDLEERTVVVEVKYPKGIFGGGVYQSNFEPIKKESEKNKKEEE